MRSRRGIIEVKALITTMVPEGIVFLPFHFHEAAANVLTTGAMDPDAKIPEFKVCAVAVEPVSRKPGTRQAPKMSYREALRQVYELYLPPEELYR